MSTKILDRRSNIPVSFVISVATILLFSFTYKNNENVFAARKTLNDTTPELASRSAEAKNFAFENNHAVKDPVPEPDSSRTGGISPASYPGGSQGWMRYLVSEFRYPEKAQRDDIQGRVIVHFVVDEKGRISNIETLTGDPILQKEAKRVLRNSGKWIPALQNGKAVTSTTEQAITFKLESNENVHEQTKTAPPGSDSSDIVYRSVDVESSYPGGLNAWVQYLNRTFRYPQEAQRNNIQGTVVVQFIVDKDGHVSDIETVSGPLFGGLREEVIRVIKWSGNWTPALQDGHPVKSYKKQPIIFKLER